MSDIDSTFAALQLLALTKGPHAGASGPQATRPLFICNDKAVATGTLTTAQRLRFGVLPAGGRIVPNLSWITSGHTATIAGKIVLRPLDGSAVQEIASVTITRDAASPAASFLTTSEPPEVEKPCWVEFVPTANTTFTGSVDVRSRMVFSLRH